MPEFKPEAFFAGITRGDGTLSQRWKASRTFRVAGTGQMDSDGSFRLDQTVTYNDGTTENRTWHLRQNSDNSYGATLSDASGTVKATVEGNVLHVRYRLRHPAVYMDQRLYLQPDGHTVLNIATVSVLGVPWARLSERIARVDSATDGSVLSRE